MKIKMFAWINENIQDTSIYITVGDGDKQKALHRIPITDIDTALQIFKISLLQAQISKSKRKLKLIQNEDTQKT